jgi:hypothetical protein
MDIAECLSQNVMVLEDQLLDAPQVGRTYAAVAGQSDGWLQPELALTVRSPDVNARGLLPFIRVEVKPE